jgi:hypothetical protein
MADTPFINSLSEADKALVRSRARNPRPTYFVGALQDQIDRSQTTGAEAQQSAEIEISEDLEAALILMPSAQKTALVNQLTTLKDQGSSSDDLELMNQVVADRVSGFSLTIHDSQGLSIKYETTRSAIIDFLVKKGDGTSQNPTAVLIPDLSNMFQMVSSALADFEKREIMATHDRIVDHLVLSSYLSNGTYKSKELLSWVNVFSAYNSV